MVNALDVMTLAKLAMGVLRTIASPAYLENIWPIIWEPAVMPAQLVLTPQLLQTTAFSAMSTAILALQTPQTAYLVVFL